MNLNELYQIKRYLDEISSLCERNATDIQHINSLIGMSLKNDLDEDLKRLLNVIRMYNSKIQMNDGIISDANCVTISEYVDDVIDSYSSMIFSGGRYYIGDLCYVEFNHNQFYDHETEYGDGELLDSDNVVYWIDSGSIGVVNFDTIKITIENAKDGNGYRICEFNHPFKVKYDKDELHLVFIKLDDKFNELNELFRILLE